jgi:hypothetical protein
MPDVVRARPLHEIEVLLVDDEGGKWPSMRAARLLAIVLLGAWGSCKGNDVKSFQAKWKALASSQTAEEEARQVRELVADSKRTGAQYQLTIYDLPSNTLIPVSHFQPVLAVHVRVEVKLQSKGDAFSWEPRDARNVLPLLGE